MYRSGRQAFSRSLPLWLMLLAGSALAGGCSVPDSSARGPDASPTGGKALSTAGVEDLTVLHLRASFADEVPANVPNEPPDLGKTTGGSVCGVDDSETPRCVVFDRVDGLPASVAEVAEGCRGGDCTCWMCAQAADPIVTPALAYTVLTLLTATGIAVATIDWSGVADDIGRWWEEHVASGRSGDEIPLVVRTDPDSGSVVALLDAQRVEVSPSGVNVVTLYEYGGNLIELLERENAFRVADPDGIHSGLVPAFDGIISVAASGDDRDEEWMDTSAWPMATRRRFLERHGTTSSPTPPEPDDDPEQQLQRQKDEATLAIEERVPYARFKPEHAKIGDIEQAATTNIRAYNPRFEVGYVDSSTRVVGVSGRSDTFVAMNVSQRRLAVRITSESSRPRIFVFSRVAEPAKHYAEPWGQGIWGLVRTQRVRPKFTAAAGTKGGERAWLEVYRRHLWQHGI